VEAHPVLVLGVFATALAAVAWSLTRPVLLVNDGHMYFEMARSMRHGTLEYPNGLDVVDSPELWTQNAVKRGAHLYSKYPPLYALLAALPYALFGIRGMYLLNAVGFVVSVLGCHALARKLLGPGRALWATLLLPVAVPLVPYVLLEIPHLTALAPLVWSVVFWDDAVREPDEARATRRGITAGLLAGLAFGIRVQDAVVVAPLFVIALFFARRPSRTLGGMAAGFGVCVLAIAAFNVQRFSSPNPFSYGPVTAALGVPIPEERADFFLRPATAADLALLAGSLVAARFCRRTWSAVSLVAGAMAIIALVSPMRDVAVRMGASLATGLLDASIASTGWAVPDTTHGWIDKALLSSMPFVALGLVGTIVRASRKAPSLPTGLAWMTVSLALFLSLRDPDPRTDRSFMGFMSLSPRYLIEVFPALYLLAWERLRAMRVRPAHVALGVACGLAAFAFMAATGRDIDVPSKVDLITTDSIVLAGLLVVAYGARREAVGAAMLPVLVAVASGYAAACVFAEDSRALLEIAAVHERWGSRVLAAMPEPKIALVGWRYAKDGVYHIRAAKDVVVVDPHVDDGAALAPTLDALADHQFAPYYFGLELERVLPRLAGRYRAVPVLDDPLLWKLERLR
jgi:hypothetical protein